MKNRTLRLCAIAIIGLGCLLCAAPVAAAPSAADKETARALVIDGGVKFEAKDFEGALRAFRAAHTIMRLPSTGLNVALTQEALGQLVEARSTALEVTRLSKEQDELESFAKARSAAAELAERVAARIPSLVIAVKGPPAGTPLDVTVDGTTIPLDTLGLPRKVNPGNHIVVVSASGYGTERRTVALGEGRTETVEILLAPSSEAAPARPAGNARPAPRTAAAADAAEGGVPAWTWGVGAAGLAALGAGVGFAIDHVNARRALANNCPEGRCDASGYTQEEMQSLRGRWNRSLALSIGLGSAGVIAVGVAIAGMAMAPPSEARRASLTSVAITPWITHGATGAMIGGLF